MERVEGKEKQKSYAQVHTIWTNPVRDTIGAKPINPLIN